MSSVRIHIFAICLLLVFMLIAVPGRAQTAGNGLAVKSVEIQPVKPEIEVGQKVKFSIIARDEQGRSLNEKPSIWIAAPFDLARVDENGMVSFYQPGEVLVGAIVAGKPVFSTVVVKPAPIKTIEIAQLASPLIVGGTIKLHATARVASGDPRTDVPLSWVSQDPAIATVDAAGVAVGISAGKTTLTASSDAVTGTVTVNVVKASISGLSVQPRTTNGKTGDVIRFNAVTQGSSGSYAPRWSVSGEGATIDSDGGFVSELPGTYLITAAIGDKIANASVVVAPRNVEREIKVVGRVPVKMEGAEVWIIGNYAYYSTIGDRFFVYDISDPAKPKLTDTVKVDSRIINDISTTADGKVLVISREGASNRKNGIAFYDTTDPAHPKLISEYTETVTGGVHSAFVDGHYVYLTDDATGSMRVIDFVDVKNPREVARWQVENPIFNTVKTPEGDQVGGRYLHDLQVKDGLAYLAYWRDGLIILDVGKGIKGGSPEKPQLVSQFRFNHNELYGNGWLAGTHSVFRYKNYVFIGDEVFPPISDIYSKKRVPVRGIVHVIDVSDINRPQKVAEYPVPEAGAHNMWVENDRMYMGYYNGGARIVDVSGDLRGDLYRQGREIGRLWMGDPSGVVSNMPFTWGAQPYKDYVVFNDINSGLWIVKVGDLIQKGSTTAPGRQ